ncbi:hypothetical protein GJU39_06415 [Pedobacter petrophilus]|uniref:Crp/Fnr family transcriptional regulator n=1 Tax=Pedobacter petrophilus TaxID=1908241 RepID=A0A7K0FVT6_9SPHI|nr:hypothetical protein [Pedobacter petrophilus]MRX75717.1 hypothetical protein [Pedobacter petrophilus]
MEKEKYLQTLSAYQKLSPGLKSYLKITLQETVFDGLEKISASDTSLGGYCYLRKGSARLFLYDTESEQEVTILFLNSTQVIPDLQPIASHFKGNLFIEFLGSSTLFFIPEKHIANLHKLFREAIPLQMAISAEAWAQTINALSDLKLLNAHQRLNKLLDYFPNIFNVAAVKNVATYLGVHPSTLSAMRTKGIKSR